MILWLAVNYERLIMKKNIFGIIVVSLLSGVILVSCQSKAATNQPVTDVVTQTVSNSIVAEGKLVPERSVELAFFPTGGVVENLYFSESSLVKTGDVLARLLVTPQQAASVASAELELVNAKKARQTFLDEADVQKTQLLMNVALAKDRLKDAASKKRDKESIYRYSKTAEATVEVGKAVADFDLATQQLAYAEAEASKWANGPDPDQLAILDAQVSNAQATLLAAQAVVTNQSELIAPFDGQLISVDVVPGQIAQSSQPVITLADTSSWLIETTDLKEVDILIVKSGSSAVVRVDAIPGVDFNARVRTIQPLGKDNQGDITYKVTLTIDSDPRFMWNMTTSVHFE
jgi:multidrug efflux pump subunit AcrA (membrane-fusion protein)